MGAVYPRQGLRALFSFRYAGPAQTLTIYWALMDASGNIPVGPANDGKAVGGAQKAVQATSGADYVNVPADMPAMTGNTPAGNYGVAAYLFDQAGNTLASGTLPIGTVQVINQAVTGLTVSISVI